MDQSLTLAGRYTERDKDTHREKLTWPYLETVRCDDFLEYIMISLMRSGSSGVGSGSELVV